MTAAKEKKTNLLTKLKELLRVRTAYQQNFSAVRGADRSLTLLEGDLLFPLMNFAARCDTCAHMQSDALHP